MFKITVVRGCICAPRVRGWRFGVGRMRRRCNWRGFDVVVVLLLCKTGKGQGPTTILNLEFFLGFQSGAKSRGVSLQFVEGQTVD